MCELCNDYKKLCNAFCLPPGHLYKIISTFNNYKHTTMKKIFHLLIFAAVIGVCSLSSCVSKGKLLASEGRVHKLENDSTATHGLLNECNLSVKDLEAQKSALQNANASAQNDLANLSSKSKMTIADQAKRLAHLQDLIQSQKDVMNKLKKNIADALVNFKADELSVYIKDGKVYVALQEKLLFKSGSDVVDPKGKEALGALAQVLNNTSDINVMIEGHTDTVPIKKDKFQDNWALSAARATSVVRILTKDYMVNPHSIVAAGGGEFYPVRSNDTDAGKGANRRTEIIISPNLSELFKLLDQ
jgi:chemotaxis protein MotB